MVDIPAYFGFKMSNQEMKFAAHYIVWRLDHPISKRIVAGPPAVPSDPPSV